MLGESKFSRAVFHSQLPAHRAKVQAAVTAFSGSLASQGARNSPRCFGAKDVGVADEEGEEAEGTARGSALIGRPWRATRPNGRLGKDGATSPKGLSAPHQRAENLVRAF